MQQRLTELALRARAVQGTNRAARRKREALARRLTKGLNKAKPKTQEEVMELLNAQRRS